MESAKEQPLVAPPSVEEEPDPQTVASSPPAAPPSLPASTAVISSVLPTKTPGDLIRNWNLLEYLKGGCRVQINNVS